MGYSLVKVTMYIRINSLHAPLRRGMMSPIKIIYQKGSNDMKTISVIKGTMMTVVNFLQQ